MNAMNAIIRPRGLCEKQGLLMPGAFSEFDLADARVKALQEQLSFWRNRRRQLLPADRWPFGNLQMLHYGALLLDPPWQYVMRTENGYDKSPEAHYDTMSDQEILDLPVGSLAGGDCLLVMWAVWPKLSLAIRCIEEWGFSLTSGGAWFKRTASGKPRMGPGYTMRTVCEPFLVARVGEPQARITDIRNALGESLREAIPVSAIGSIGLQGIAREHSRKPPQMRQLVERMTPNAFRAELFAREAWAGNDVWGNQTDKFNDVLHPMFEDPEIIETDPAEMAGQFALFDPSEVYSLAQEVAP